MADPVTTVVQRALDAGIIDDLSAQTLPALHRQDQTSDLADAPEAVRQALDASRQGQATDLSPEARSAKGERFGPPVPTPSGGRAGAR